MSPAGTETLLIEQTTWKNSSFNISLQGVPWGEFQAPPMKWEGVFIAGGRRYSLKTKSMFTSAARLLGEDGTELAVGASGGLFSSSYAVTAAGKSYTIKPLKNATLVYGVFDGEAQTGQAQAAAAGSSSGSVTLPASMPLEARLLMMWYLGRTWRNSKETGSEAYSSNT